MSLTTFISTIELGLVFAVLACGLIISFRILNLPDLTVDGSFVTGAAVSAMCCTIKQPFLTIVASLLAGALAGLITGVLHTKLKIQSILAGILTMTALYSINLKITNGAPSVFLYGMTTIFDAVSAVILLSVIVLLVIAVLVLFLKTPLGLALRATGDNEMMVRSSSINTDTMKILGLMLANSLVAFSGALYTQLQSSYDHACGNGMMVLGLASIIIGERLIHSKSSTVHFLSAAFGAVIYRFLIVFAFQLGLPASDLKLFSALIVIGSMIIPMLIKRFEKRGKMHA